MVVYLFYNIKSRPFSCRMHQIYVLRIDSLEIFLDVFVRVAERSYAFKTQASIGIDPTLRQIYVLRIDPLEIFLDVFVRVAERSYAFKT